MTQTVVLKVAMSCQGCVGAVNRVLGKMEGVESYDINKDEQKVTVKGNVEPEAVFQTVSKTGKKTSFWEEAPPTETEPETKITETPETKPAEPETKTAETETKPAEPETKPAEPETKPAEPETKPAEVAAA